MGRQYAKGSRAWGICGRSGKKALLSELIFDGRYPNMRVLPDWYEARHPLETLPMVDDPVALYRPSPEVNNAPSAPSLTLLSYGPSQINLTWTPAESGVTDIASYLIFRSLNGAPFVQIAECDLVRDFLGGITGITNATFPQYPEHPGDPWTNVPPDQPATFADTNISVGFEYCYYVQAVPLGNNQSVAQGPPVNSPTVCLTVALESPTLSGSYDFTNTASDLSWTMPGSWGASVQNYQIYRSAAGGTFSLLTTVSGTTTSYTDSTATDWKDGYQYYIVAQYAAGNSAPSNTASFPNSVTTVYTANTFWQGPPGGAKYVRVRAVAGGQGGASGNGSATPPNYGWGGVGGGYVDAFFLPTALTYPVQITIGQGGAGDNSNSGTSGAQGTDTTFGSSFPYYVHAIGGQPGQSSGTANGAQSFTQENGGIWDGVHSPNTTYAGAAGGGAYFRGTGDNPPGVASGGGPGGNGGAGAAIGGSPTGSLGANYGGAGGGGIWNGSSFYGGGGNGAPGVLMITLYS
jgi:hypothetical protein